jgi:putative ATPase
MAAAGGTAQVDPPLHILNAPTKMMEKMGYGAGYRYDHDEPHAYAGQEFLPEALIGSEFYKPNERGFEKDIKRRLEFWSGSKAKRRGGSHE